MRTRKSVSTQRESWTFTPLVFTTTGGIWKECLMYHSRLAQLIAIKKGEQYAKTISWIRTRTSFALLRSVLVCLRGSRTWRVPCDIKNVDLDVDVVEAAIHSDYWCVSLLLNDFFSDYLSKKCNWPWKRSEEHTSELQSHHPISYAVFCPPPPCCISSQ